MSDSIKIQRILNQTGGYCCPHFSISKSEVKSACCGGDKGAQYAPVCNLTKTVCTGLAQCPRLDIKSKSQFIQQWKEDVHFGKKIDPSGFIK